jgi:hypothetical protein
VELRGTLKIAFVTRTSEIFSALAEGQNRHRHSQSYVEDEFWPDNAAFRRIAAVRSKNEFFEVPLNCNVSQKDL